MAHHPEDPDITIVVLSWSVVLVLGLALLIMLIYGCSTPVEPDHSWWEALTNVGERPDGKQAATAEGAANQTLVWLTVLSLFAAFGCSVACWLTHRYRRWGVAALAFVGMAATCVALAKVFMLLVWALLLGILVFVCWTCWRFRHFDLYAYLREGP